MKAEERARMDGRDRRSGGERIGLAHGNGGRWMRELIDGVIAPALDSPGLDTRHDSATLAPGGGEPVMTTDGFTVQPLEFPGGDIGSLAVYGTVNDLAVAGARPHALSLNLIIEEGLPVEVLRRVLRSAGQAAREAGASIVTGDSKVVRRGEGGGLYLVTTGIGYRPERESDPWRPTLGELRPGDEILISGPIGDHGIAVMLAREEFGMRGDLESDAASVLPLAEAAWPLPGLRFLRDPTRGGLAEVLHEVRRQSGHGIRVSQSAVPVRPPVVGVCEMLGYDPWYLACEGRIVAVTAAGAGAGLLKRWRGLPGGAAASLIGRVEEGQDHVLLETPIGGERLLEELEDDPLPRIC